MKKFGFIVPAMLAMSAGFMTSCSSASEDILGPDVPSVNMVVPNNQIELSKEQREMVSTNNTFALNLFNNICNSDKSKSTFCSPLSVTYLLSMLN